MARNRNRPTCQLCWREPATQFHHFIPRTVHSNKWFRKRYSRLRMAEGIHVCRQCHGMIHETVPSEKQLGREFNALDKLRAHPDLARYLAWKRRR